METIEPNRCHAPLGTLRETQLRYRGGQTHFYPNIKEAFDVGSKSVRHLIKISWYDMKNQLVRFVPKYNDPKQNWKESSEKKISELNPAYLSATQTDLFWVRQNLLLSHDELKQIFDEYACEDSKRHLDKLQPAEEKRSHAFIYLEVMHMTEHRPEVESAHDAMLIVEVLSTVEFTNKYC